MHTLDFKSEKLIQLEQEILDLEKKHDQLHGERKSELLACFTKQTGIKTGSKVFRPDKPWHKWLITELYVSDNGRYFTIMGRRIKKTGQLYPLQEDIKFHVELLKE